MVIACQAYKALNIFSHSTLSNADNRDALFLTIVCPTFQTITMRNFVDKFSSLLSYFPGVVFFYYFVGKCCNNFVATLFSHYTAATWLLCFLTTLPCNFTTDRCCNYFLHNFLFSSYSAIWLQKDVNFWKPFCFLTTGIWYTLTFSPKTLLVTGSK